VIRVDKVSVDLGGRSILADLSLEVSAGETLALLGPSGSGKSTLLRVIAGLQQPAPGRVLLDGTDVTAVPAHRRGVGLVFQDAVLFPHRDVGRNVAFGLAGADRGVAGRRVDAMLELVGLTGFARRAVGTLSGGEAQRVALARALAPAPRVLLLDEPLASLDGPLRDRLQDDLRNLFARLGLTVLHVTHDVAEAFALGRRVAVMREGRVAQVDTPEELWRHPADAWVAGFLGMHNLLVRDGRRVVVRPEAVQLSPGEDGTVVTAERRGPSVVIGVRCDDGSTLESVTTALDHPNPGDRVQVVVDPLGVIALGPGARMIRRRVVVHGRVQGVWFRESTRLAADRHRVAGWVRNRPDGAVEVVLEGGEDAVARVIDVCRLGPPGSRVDRVDVVPEQPEGLVGFRVC